MSSLSGEFMDSHAREVLQYSQVNQTVIVV